MGLVQKKNNKIALKLYSCVKKLPTNLTRSKPLFTVKNQIKTFLTIIKKLKKKKNQIKTYCLVDHSMPC